MDWIEHQLAFCKRNGIRATYNYAEDLPERRRMVQAYADYLDGLRCTSENAESEKQTDKTEDFFRKNGGHCFHRKIDENAQITEKDTAWSEAYREKLQAADYGGMDMAQAWYG